MAEGSSSLEKQLSSDTELYKSPKHLRAKQIRKSVEGLFMFPVQASAVSVRFGRMLSKEGRLE